MPNESGAVIAERVEGFLANYSDKDYMQPECDLVRDLLRELNAARAELAEARKDALHDAWLECKAIESEFNSRNDPYDEELGYVATKCADAIEALTIIDAAGSSSGRLTDDHEITAMGGPT